MNDKITILDGDGFLIDSDKTGARIVKFFQTAPTIFQHLWRKLRGTQETVLYYHAGLFGYVNGELKIIEQQSKVVVKDANKVLNTSNRLFIFRRKDISDAQRRSIVEDALADVGLGYDVLNCFGKFLTWLTGIPLFAEYVELPDVEICINRMAKNYLDGIGETFGARKHSSLTTHLVYKYIKAHQEKFEIIFEGVPNG